jgi:hypothetical protein
MSQTWDNFIETKHWPSADEFASLTNDEKQAFMDAQQIWLNSRTDSYYSEHRRNLRKKRMEKDLEDEKRK